MQRERQLSDRIIAGDGATPKHIKDRLREISERLDKFEDLKAENKNRNRSRRSSVPVSRKVLRGDARAWRGC